MVYFGTQTNRAPNARLNVHPRCQSATLTAKSVPARAVVPGIAQKLNHAKCDGSPAKIIAPATSDKMAKNVLNANRDSTSDTQVTRLGRYSFVAKTVTHTQAGCNQRMKT